MTEEISIRASRARRGVESGDPLTRDEPPDRDGETAWSLDEPAAENEPERHRSEEPAPFPPFPDLGGVDQEEQAGPSLDVRRFLRGLWTRRWLIVGITGVFVLLSALLAFTLLDRKWEAAAVLVQRTHQDKFALGSSTPFNPQEYNLKTMLDTGSWPSRTVTPAGFTPCGTWKTSDATRNSPYCTSIRSVCLPASRR